MTQSAVRLWSVLAVLIATFAAAMLPATAGASIRREDPPTAASIGGYIVTRHPDRPDRQIYVADATVELRALDGTVLATTTSARNGSYRFVELRPGRYGIHAFKRGVGEGRARVAAQLGVNRVRVILRRP